jgi:phosphoglycerate dehydrogenase-like enzyme
VAITGGADVGLRIVAAVHDPPVWTMPPVDVARLRDELTDDEVVDVRTPEDRRREFPLADILLTTRLTSDEARLLSRARWIQSTAVGVGGLLTPEIVASPIVVTNARGVHAEFIAEHAIALTLALRRQLHVAAARQREAVWAQAEIQALASPPLAGTPMLVAGLGEIGRRIARLAAGLGFHVIGLRRQQDAPVPDGVRELVAAGDLLDVLPRVRAVVLALPRTSDTRAMFGAEELAALPDGAVLVNIARGRLVDEAALIDALRSGRLAAGLDVFEREPLPAGHPLWTLPNVLITPHTAAFGEDYWTPAIALFKENLERFKRGDSLLNVVDKEHGY